MMLYEIEEAILQKTLHEHIAAERLWPTDTERYYDADLNQSECTTMVINRLLEKQWGVGLADGVYLYQDEAGHNHVTSDISKLDRPGVLFD
jgi:hypothetical protein